MSHLLPLPVFGFASGEIIGFTVILTAIAGGCAMGIMALCFHHQRRRLWHETARIALEKGQPLPVQVSWENPQEPDWSRTKYNPRWGYLRDLRGGLVLIAIGGAVFFSRPGSWTPSWDIATYVPSFIGAALVLNALINAFFSPKEKDAGDQPPQK